MPEPRHVVFLATDFRPLTGGIAEDLHHLAHHLCRHVPVTVMTTVPQNGANWERAYRLVALPPLPERRLGGRIGDGIPAVRKLHTGAYFYALRAHARRLAGEVKRTGDETVAVVGSWDTASHFWCEACRLAGIPYSLFVHGAEVLLPLYGRLPEWRRQDFARADHVLANSKATAELAMEQLALEKSPAAVNGSTAPRPCDELVIARAQALRRELDLDGGPVVFSLGRLISRKGFDLVLRATADLSAEIPGLSCVIAGDGPERSALEALARELGIAHRVRIVGPVDAPTKWAMYHLCDVFAMPNRSLGGTDWEGFGLVFVEAAQSARPSIGGKTGGTSDAVIDNVTGLLVDPEDPRELVAALRLLLADEDLRRRMGSAGRDFAATRFSGEAVAERLWGVIR